METLPLTPHMIQKITECHEMTVQNIPCRIRHFNNCLEGLLKRGLVDLQKKNIEGKMIETVFLTPKALQLLNLADANILYGSN